MRKTIALAFYFWGLGTEWSFLGNIPHLVCMYSNCSENFAWSHMPVTYLLAKRGLRKYYWKWFQRSSLHTINDLVNDVQFSEETDQLFAIDQFVPYPIRWNHYYYPSVLRSVSLFQMILVPVRLSLAVIDLSSCQYYWVLFSMD